MEDGHQAVLRQFLERCCVAVRAFQHDKAQFERLKADSFWEASRQKPKDASRSKWALYFIMQAKTPNVRSRAGRYAVVLDGLIGDDVAPNAVAARIKDMGGVEEAYEAFRGHSRNDAPEETGHGDDSDAAGDEAWVEDEEACADDEGAEGSVGPTVSGRPALRSSGAGDHTVSRAREIDLENAVLVDSENDLLGKIRDIGARCREPKRFHLAVTVYPEDADGWVRVVGDEIVLSS